MRRRRWASRALGAGLSALLTACSAVPSDERGEGPGKADDARRERQTLSLEVVRLDRPHDSIDDLEGVEVTLLNGARVTLSRHAFGDVFVADAADDHGVGASREALAPLLALPVALAGGGTELALLSGVVVTGIAALTNHVELGGTTYEVMTPWAGLDQAAAALATLDDPAWYDLAAQLARHAASTPVDFVHLSDAEVRGLPSRVLTMVPHSLADEEVREVARWMTTRDGAMPAANDPVLDAVTRGELGVDFSAEDVADRVPWLAGVTPFGYILLVPGAGAPSPLGLALDGEPAVSLSIDAQASLAFAAALETTGATPDRFAMWWVLWPGPAVAAADMALGAMSLGTHLTATFCDPKFVAGLPTMMSDWAQNAADARAGKAGFSILGRYDPHLEREHPQHDCLDLCQLAGYAPAVPQIEPVAGVRTQIVLACDDGAHARATPLEFRWGASTLDGPGYKLALAIINVGDRTVRYQFPADYPDQRLKQLAGVGQGQSWTVRTIDQLELSYLESRVEPDWRPDAKRERELVKFHRAEGGGYVTVSAIVD